MFPKACKLAMGSLRIIRLVVEGSELSVIVQRKRNMRSIERLPENTRSTVRSGVVVCDLTRIVEELVVNSLEAGATEVSVSVGVGTSYLKVVDNGSGITRDGLVWLGERYVTSKVDHLALVDASAENLDYHGEALCSISDVALLEIVTKARGKPNGYRKIIKESKCLFLGINNDRQDVGTTVTVHDIFYNQPVRRKHMQSSPKKVLDSIKMSVLRIALVHVNVFFRVVDVESLDELLCVGPSSSPLPILSTYFGIESSSSFHKLVLSDEDLKLSGYISEPHGIFSLKAIQYVYINSRFIYKGPIHKLVNKLAAKFDPSTSWQLATSSQREKQNKYDKCPAFILNLQCPTSAYVIIDSERSRASVEFKDWAPVLTLIQDGVMRLWTKNMPHDMLGNLESRNRSCWKQNSLIPPDICSPNWKKPCKNKDNTLALEETVFTFGQSCRKVSELKKHEVEADLICDTEYRSRACDAYLVAQAGIEEKGIKTHVSPWSVSSPVHVTSTYRRNMNDLSSAVENIIAAYNETDRLSIECGGSIDCPFPGDEDQGHSISFLRCCSYGKSLMQERRSPSRYEQFEFGHGCGTKRRRLDFCDIMKDENLVLCERDFQCSAAQTFQYSPGTKYGMLGMLVSPVRDLAQSSFLENTLSDSEQYWESTSSLQSFRFGYSPVTTKELTRIKFCEDDNYPIEESSFEGHSGFVKDVMHGCPTQREVQDLRHTLEDTKCNLLQYNCSFMKYPPYTERELGGTQWDFSLKPFKRFTDADWPPSPFLGEESFKNYSGASSYDTPPDECERGIPNGGNERMMLNRKKSFTRSHSAPPCYKGKRRFLDLTDTSSLSAKNNFQNISAGHSSMVPSKSSNGQLDLEAMNLKCSDKPLGQFHLSQMKNPAISVFEMKPQIAAVQNRGPKDDQLIDIGNVKCLNLKEFQGSLDPGWKWRNGCLPTAGKSTSDIKKDQDSILDIFSDILQLDGDSLVPKSIERACLEDAKVLNQVDKKFIAVAAGKTLALIDQHAADERIKLEELRHNVLSGEMKTIKYLDSEHELVLPEVGYQLLHNYAEQIKTWGWICNIHSLDSNSFTKNLDFLHRQPTVVKLLAVPCILGVTLNDIDLLEFLQQLADTDGSSTTPPSVHRVLNRKACRGAIMFGDALLPSECSLIVDELKRTSLCFQCAHGRPTTVPLVNLDALHNKVARLGPDESWHGLRQHKLSLKRTSQRLRSALS